MRQIIHKIIVSSSFGNRWITYSPIGLLEPGRIPDYSCFLTIPVVKTRK